MKQRPTISQSDCDVWWKVQDLPVQWLDWEEAPKLFPEPNLHQVKGSWSLFSDLLLIWFTTDFWILAKPLHLRNTLSNLMGCPANRNARSEHWSTERPQFFSMTMPNYPLYNQSFKSRMHWATGFCLICHTHLTSHLLNTTSSSTSTTFCKESASTTSRSKETLSKSLLNPEAQIFMLLG